MGWISFPVLLNVANFITAAVCAVYAWQLYKITRIKATLCLMWGFIVGAALRLILIRTAEFPVLQIFIVTWVLLTMGMAGLYDTVKKIWEKPEGTR